MKLNNLVPYFIQNPDRVFLADGIGALLTACLVGFVLPSFPLFFGVPPALFYPLAFIAALFAVYSFCCFIFVREKRVPYLQIIMIANLLYCCLTAVLVIIHFQTLRWPGILYFAAELLVILCLVSIEKRAVQQEKSINRDN